MNLMKEGKLVPMEVTIGLLKTAMMKAVNNNFLIDGFPRALDQAASFESRVQEAGAYTRPLFGST
jgi:adenylate kinase family enzyme